MTGERASTISRVQQMGYLILLLATVTGLWQIGVTLFQGHLQMATTQHVPWGLWVAAYLFFIGLSTGSFLISTLVYTFGVRRLAPVGPLALLVALGSLVVGGLLIVLDLGHPERIYKVLISPNPSSPLAWMGYSYNAYAVIVLASLYFVLRPRLVDGIRSGDAPVGLYRLLTLGRTEMDPARAARDARWLKVLGIVGIAVAVFVQASEGMIFAVAKARPTWFGGLFPIVFLIGAMVAAGGSLTFLVAILSRRPQEEKLKLLRTLVMLTVGLLAVELVILFSEVFTALYGNIPQESEAWKMTLFGPHWYVFWIVQLALGAVAPILLVTLAATRNRVAWLGLAGFLMSLGMVGGRLSIVIPGQIVPTFEGMDRVYNHTRFALGYYPSTSEWLVVIGTVAIGIWLLVAAVKLLPLDLDSQVPQGGN